MKKITALLVFLILPSVVLACPECERKQLDALKGVAHGAGPQQNWDYWIVGFIALIVVVSLFYSIKWLIRPGEKNDSHIKREVLNFD